MFSRRKSCSRLVGNCKRCQAMAISRSSERVPNAGQPHGIDTGTRSHAAGQHQSWHVDINVFPDSVNVTVKFGRSGRSRGRGVTESSRS